MFYVPGPLELFLRSITNLLIVSVFKEELPQAHWNFIMPRSRISNDYVLRLCIGKQEE